MNNTALIIGGGLVGVFLLSRAKAAPVASLTPAQAANLAAAQTAARLRGQQNNTLTQLLAGILGKGSAQSQSAPKATPGAGGGGASGVGTHASSPSLSPLGNQNPATQCPICASNMHCTAFFENGDGTITVNGQVLCEATGLPVEDGPFLPDGQCAAGVNCPMGQLNDDGGICDPAGGVACFSDSPGIICSACTGGCAALSCFC